MGKLNLQRRSKFIPSSEYEIRIPEKGEWFQYVSLDGSISGQILSSDHPRSWSGYSGKFYILGRQDEDRLPDIRMTVYRGR